MEKPSPAASFVKAGEVPEQERSPQGVRRKITLPRFEESRGAGRISLPLQVSCSNEAKESSRGGGGGQGGSLGGRKKEREKGNEEGKKRERKKGNISSGGKVSGLPAGAGALPSAGKTKTE